MHLKLYNLTHFRAVIEVKLVLNSQFLYVALQMKAIVFLTESEAVCLQRDWTYQLCSNGPFLSTGNALGFECIYILQQMCF